MLGIGFGFGSENQKERISMSVSTKSCIVTGAANGVGLAIARRMAEEGARVVLADMDEANLNAEVKALVEAGYEAHAFVGDLRQKLSIANLLSATIAAYDRVDILVNASRRVELCDPMKLSEELLTEMFTHNVTANLRLTNAVVKKMIKQAEEEENDGPSGAIVNLTSIASNRTLPNLTGFSVVSAALDQLTRSLAVSFAKNRIRVNGIAIGSIKSATLRDALQDNNELRDMIIAATPAGRIGEAEEAADAALFLASNQASFITGQILAIDGGRSLIDPLATPAH